ncbi:MAG: excinuclease ABC subunit A, partial [Bacteroidales bacterium]
MPLKSEDNRNSIIISGARVNNLKNIDLVIPRNRLIVITGLSGSGKSSLAFDTIYAEGQRRYVESLSAYARQFLGRMNKPEVDFIKGIPPAIAIEQKVNIRNPRSTVGTSTEIYDYLKLLYARIGKTYSPVSNKEVKKDSVSDVVDYITSFKDGQRILILSPLKTNSNLSIAQQLKDLNYQGIVRLEIDGTILKIADIPEDGINEQSKINIVIDRVTVNHDDDSVSRYADSVQMAYKLSEGICIIKILDEKSITERSFSNIFELDGIKFNEPSVHMFSFNNP